MKRKCRRGILAEGLGTGAGGSHTGSRELVQIKAAGPRGARPKADNSDAHDERPRGDRATSIAAKDPPQI
jgi:hypothetical protein